MTHSLAVDGERADGAWSGASVLLYGLIGHAVMRRDFVDRGLHALAKTDTGAGVAGGMRAEH